jgi:hypothetical protein
MKKYPEGWSVRRFTVFFASSKDKWLQLFKGRKLFGHNNTSFNLVRRWKGDTRWKILQLHLDVFSVCMCVCAFACVYRRVCACMPCECACMCVCECVQGNCGAVSTTIYQEQCAIGVFLSMYCFLTCGWIVWICKLHHIRTCAALCLHAYVCTYLYIYTHVIYALVLLCVYMLCIYVHTYVYVCTYMHMYIRMYVHTYACSCVCSRGYFLAVCEGGWMDEWISVRNCMVCQFVTRLM